MTKEQLCALALAAVDDEDARLVLADAIEQSGWETVERRTQLGQLFDNRRKHRGTLSEMLTRRSAGQWRSALAAVLLCGDWPTSWPLATACHRDDDAHDQGHGFPRPERGRGLRLAGLDARFFQKILAYDNDARDDVVGVFEVPSRERGRSLVALFEDEEISAEYNGKASTVRVAAERSRCSRIAELVAGRADLVYLHPRRPPSDSTYARKRRER